MEKDKRNGALTKILAAIGTLLIWIDRCQRCQLHPVSSRLVYHDKAYSSDFSLYDAEYG